MLRVQISNSMNAHTALAGNKVGNARKRFMSNAKANGNKERTLQFQYGMQKHGQSEIALENKSH